MTNIERAQRWLDATEPSFGMIFTAREIIKEFLSQLGAETTLPSDNHEGDGDAQSDEVTERELLDGDAEQRGETSVPGLRAEERDEQGGRRVLPLDSVPLVRLAHGAERDRPHVLTADCWCGPTVEKVGYTATAVAARDCYGTRATLASLPRCDRAASRSLRNVEFFIRSGDLADAKREIRRVVRMVEWMENERGVRCDCAEATETTPSRPPAGGAS